MDSPAVPERVAVGASGLKEFQGPGITLPVFSGPLDLLLHLVRENRVSIWDIPIATICHQYHAWLASMRELDLVIAGEYLVYATWLLAIKSRMLLPRREKAGEDPRAALVERLLAYEKVKKQAAELAGLLALREGIWPVAVEFAGKKEEASWELEEVDVQLLGRVLRQVLDRFRREHPGGLVLAPLRYTVQEKMQELAKLLEESRSFPLLTHMLTRSDRWEAVTWFLAGLELVWLKVARVHQRLPFSEIYLTPTGQTVSWEDAFFG